MSVVKYCRHPVGPPISFLQSNRRTLISYALFVAVPPNVNDAVAHVSPSLSTIMCWPVFVPQMIGTAPALLDVVKVSVIHAPLSCVNVPAVGPPITNVAKSSLIRQMLLRLGPYKYSSASMRIHMSRRLCSRRHNLQHKFLMQFHQLPNIPQLYNRCHFDFLLQHRHHS